jgi:putative component of membrane protein insertase Oxa1/YidC/SpoIIIJ protein YidD
LAQPTCRHYEARGQVFVLAEAHTLSAKRVTRCSSCSRGGVGAPLHFLLRRRRDDLSATLRSRSMSLFSVLQCRRRRRV